MKVLFQTKVPLQWVPALLKSLVFVAVMTAVFGVLYPAAVTGVALLFPAAREGNLVQFEGRVVGSRLIGQDFWRTDLFAGRPSANAVPYDARESRATNLAPGNPRFKTRVKAAVAAWQQRTGLTTLPPADLVTASASGLDPHISEAGALWQVPFVARNTGLTEDEVKAVIEEEAEVGLFSGKRFLNVLRLNERMTALRRRQETHDDGNPR